MEGHVLGVISAEVPGRKGFRGHAKVPALFGLLATSPDLQHTMEEIARHLWPGEEYSEDRVSQVVSSLRKSLGEEILPRIRSGICTINPPAASIDYLRFREEAHKAKSQRWPEKFERYDIALAEWPNEEPLLGLSEEGFGIRKSQLREERLVVVFDRMEAAWHAERHEWLHGEARRWYNRLPDRPRAFQYFLLTHGWAMRSTQRDRMIRQWLSRHTPDDELHSIIELVHGAPSRSRRTTPRAVPDQLPAPQQCFVGREAQLQSLTDFVHERRAKGAGALILLSGMPGVGKSTMAHHLAHSLRKQFPDGALHVDLHGFTGEDVAPADPEHVLDRFLAELTPQVRAVGLDDKSAALRTALAERAVLLVLDNARSAAQVLPLLPGAGQSTALVTSRSTLTTLCHRQNARLSPVQLLDDEAAAQLIQEKVCPADRLKHARVFRELVRLCGNLPLALTVVARRMEGRPIRSVDGLVHELEEEKGRLRALHVPEHEISVQMALNCSVRALSDDAQRLLWQLAVHPGPSIGWEAVMDLGLACDGMRADRAVEELSAANLVERLSDRYRLHDLVRAYARHEIDPSVRGTCQDFEKATVRQILEHELHHVHACDRLLDRQRRLPIGEPDGGALQVRVPADLDDAMNFLDEEYETALRCIHLAHQHEQPRYTWLLSMTLVTYQWRRHRLGDALRGLQQAREVAESIARPVDIAMTYRMLAGTLWRQGEPESATQNLRRAVRLSEGDDSHEGRLSLAISLQALATTLRSQARRHEDEENASDLVDEVEELLQRALELYRGLSDTTGEAAVLNGIGTLHHDRGEHDLALRICADALRLGETTQDPNGRANVLCTLAKIHLSRLERREAIVLYRRASEIYNELGYWPNEDRTLCRYADALVSTGDTPEAVRALERVLVLRERMGGRGMQEVRDRLEGLR